MKAGPLDGPKHRPQSWWRREKFRITIISLGLLVFGYTFLNSNLGVKKYVSWKTDSGFGPPKEDVSSKGSQYLLGVGKADITG
jgi:neutral ceramidase